jgi:hypothetical protein
MALQVAIPIRINRRYVTMLLAAYGVSQRRIAEQAALSRQTVAKTLKNRRDVSTDKKRAVLHAIAALTGREPEELCLPGRLAA